MADIVLEVDKGRNSGTDQKRLPEGFVARAKNFIYEKKDPSRLHKIAGRTLMGSIAESGVTAANTDGVAYARYDEGTDQILLQANSQLYETNSAVSLGSWTSVTKQDGPNTPFARAGSFIKTIQDPLRRNIVFSGADGEQPLVRDADGNWRYLSLVPPGVATLSTTVAAAGAAILRPNADEGQFTGGGAPTTTSEGAATAEFDHTLFTAAKAWDGDVDTYAYKHLTSSGIVAHDFTFAASTSTNYTITVDYEAGASGSPKIEDPLDAYILLQTNIGSGFTSFHSSHVIDGITRVSSNISTAFNPSALTVRVILNYRTDSLYSVFIKVKDIRILQTDVHPTTVLTGASTGRIQYAVTEAYRTTLTNGKNIFVESAPSELAVDEADLKTEGIAYDGTSSSHTSIRLALPAQANYIDDTLTKYPSARQFLFKRIYRSVDGGVYPNLGLIAEVELDATYFYDTFAQDKDTLGAPGLNVLYVGDAIYNVAEAAPAFVDATNYEGSIVAIPTANPHSIRWSPPGSPDYFPIPHEFSFFTGDFNNEGKGITSIGDTIILFLRNSVLRIRDLAMATGGPEFNPIDQMKLRKLTSTEGLAAGPLGYCGFHSQVGHDLVGWISHSGIWITDGSLPSERGMGVVRITTHMDWEKDVDVDRLGEAQLHYDGVLQAIIFDCFDPEGNAQTYYFHTAARHWVTTGEDQLVPKLSGPHTLTSNGRAIGDNGTNLLHWVLDTANLRLLNERTGADNVGSLITSVLETGWVYPTGPRTGFQIYAGEVYHSDWGSNEVCDVEIQTRRDVSGVIQSSHKKGISLSGDRLTPLIHLKGSGQSLRAFLSHTGKTTASGKPVRAVGPIVIDGEGVGEIRRD